MLADIKRRKGYAGSERNRCRQSASIETIQWKWRREREKRVCTHMLWVDNGCVDVKCLIVGTTIFSFDVKSFFCLDSLLLCAFSFLDRELNRITEEKMNFVCFSFFFVPKHSHYKFCCYEERKRVNFLWKVSRALCHY